MKNKSSYPFELTYSYYLLLLKINTKAKQEQQNKLRPQLSNIPDDRYFRYLFVFALILNK